MPRATLFKPCPQRSSSGLPRVLQRQGRLHDSSASTAHAREAEKRDDRCELSSERHSCRAAMGAEALRTGEAIGSSPGDPQASQAIDAASAAERPGAGQELGPGRRDDAPAAEAQGAASHASGSENMAGRRGPTPPGASSEPVADPDAASSFPADRALARSRSPCADADADDGAGQCRAGGQPATLCADTAGGRAGHPVDGRAGQPDVGTGEFRRDHVYIVAPRARGRKDASWRTSGSSDCAC